MDIADLKLECEHCGTSIPEENIGDYVLLKAVNGSVRMGYGDSLNVLAAICPKCFRIALFQGGFITNHE